MKSPDKLTTCPHCTINSPNITWRKDLITKSRVGNDEYHWNIYACERCGGVIVSRLAEKEIIEVFPISKEIDNSIPPTAIEYLKQAFTTVHAPVASVIVSARAIDEMLKEKGYTDGSLYERIESATKNHLITKEMAQWAHEIRLDANNHRHADVTIGLPTGKDAKRCVEFALALAEFLFVLPTRIQRGLTKPNETDD